MMRFSDPGRVTESHFVFVGVCLICFCFLWERDKMAAEIDNLTDDVHDVEETASDVKQISIAVQQGQKRRVMKGMTYHIDEKHGYIYLVRTREFKALHRPIYKVGRTSQCPDTRITRLHKYTKGSEIYLILQCHVEDVSLIEKEILERFCHRYDPGPDGSEDFIIPTAQELMDAKQIIMDIIRHYEERRL